MHHGDIEAAVEAGVIDSDVARQLRNFTALRHAAPLADEERFGVVSGLADVMTAIGLAMLLAGVAAVGLLVGILDAAIVMGAAWALAEYFTRRRRMTLTSVVLFAFFALAVAMGLVAVALRFFPDGGLDLKGTAQAIAVTPLSGLFIAGGTTMACAAWWLRFRLPFAYMVTAVAAVNLAVHVLRMIVPGAPASLVSVVLLLTGVALFVAAMAWDMTDVRRETRRCDIAFWLHWAAGYQIAHAAFRILLGVKGDAQGWDRLYAFETTPASGATLIGVAVLFAAFCLTALVIDRRSLLLSSLVFVLPGMTTVISDVPLVGLTVTAILAGGFLVLLAGFWHRARAAVMPLVPAMLRAQLPRTQLTFDRLRPVA